MVDDSSETLPLVPSLVTVGIIWRLAAIVGSVECCISYRGVEDLSVLDGDQVVALESELEILVELE